LRRSKRSAANLWSPTIYKQDVRKSGSRTKNSQTRDKRRDGGTHRTDKRARITPSAGRLRSSAVTTVVSSIGYGE
jgi:hypothetical protein